MFRNFKYVFYFEALLMSVTVVLGLFAPRVFLQQLTPIEPTELAVQLARWYAVPFIPQAAIQIATLFSGNLYALRLVMVTFMVADCVQLVVTVIFADAMGWQLTHYVSGITAVVFAISRAVCFVDPTRIGVKLWGEAARP